MKALSPVDKHLLYWRDKRIVEWIQHLFPNVEIIGETKTSSRRETLKQISNYEDTCILDCDVIPFELQTIKFKEDTLVCFYSQKQKYGSVIVETGKIVKADETNNISTFKCSGAYFVKSVADTINKMTNENSIASAMIGADALLERSFVRLGDVEDYMEAL